MRIKPERLWKLRRCIERALVGPQLKGLQLRRIRGHVAWASIVRREMLSILGVCYHFCKAPGALWGNVRQELRWVKALLPLRIQGPQAALVASGARL